MGFLEANVYWVKGWQEARAGRNLCMLSKFSFLRLSRQDLHARGSKTLLKNPPNWLTAIDSCCVHGWKSMDFRLSCRKYLNKIRAHMYAFWLMSLAGVFRCEVCVGCFYVAKWSKSECVNDHFQKHQGPQCVHCVWVESISSWKTLW